MIDYPYLVLEEHPYGRSILQVLLENGLPPSLVIMEVSTLAVQEQRKFLERIEGQIIPPTINQLLSGTNIPIYTVPNHNDPSCEFLLQMGMPDIVVLGGTRIIKPHILKIPHTGMLNAHPGLLPWLRGSASVGWALYKDLPVGATVHFIDSGIDTGMIIYRETLPITQTDTYESINARIAVHSGQLMARALTDIIAGALQPFPQETCIGETLKVIPDELLQIGKQRLSDHTYSHYVI